MPTRWRNKDLIGLYYSAINIGLSFRDYCLFLKTYFDKPLKDIFKTEAGLIREAELTAFKIRARSVKKGYEKPALGRDLFSIGKARYIENTSNPQTCFKVVSRTNSSLINNDIKYRYFLMKKGIQPSFLPKFYGYFDTSDIIGCELEHLTSSTHLQCVTMTEFLKTAEAYELNELRTRLDNIKQEIIRLNIVFAEIKPENICLLLKRTDRTVERIVFYSSLGSFNLIPLPLLLRLLGRRLIEREWQRFWQILQTELPSNARCLHTKPKQ